jgi:hypothetical protein
VFAEEEERHKLLAWVPVIKGTIEEAQRAVLAAKLVEASGSPKSPTDRSYEKQARGESASWPAITACGA